MTERPPWAGASNSTGFTAPAIARPFPAEPRVEGSARPTQRVTQSGRWASGRIVTILLTMLVVVFVVAAALLAWKALAPPDVSAPVPATQFQRPADGTAVGPDGNTPVALENSATAPHGHKKMTAADMAPNTMFIPALGVYMPVEADTTFVASHYSGFDTIRIPANPRRGVWYAAGAPLYGGQAGTTLIASHVSNGGYGWGALRYLYTLTGGEMIYTKDKAGQLQSWQVTRMRVEDHKSFPQEYWSAKGVRQLVVVTCGGRLRAGHYDKNIFAIAAPVDPKPAPEPAATSIPASTATPVPTA